MIEEGLVVIALLASVRTSWKVKIYYNHYKYVRFCFTDDVDIVFFRAFLAVFSFFQVSMYLVVITEAWKMLNL